jgi:hypothetical protein
MNIDDANDPEWTRKYQHWLNGTWSPTEDDATGKGAKSVAEDLEAVLRKIQYWHQGSIAGYLISFQDGRGTSHAIECDGQEARIGTSS